MGCCGSDVDDSSLEEDKKKELKGPLEDRGCTDIIMLLVFACFVVGMVAIAGVSLRSGDPRRIVYGTDSWGNLCGRDNEQAIDSPNSGLDLSDQRYLMFSDPSDDDAFRMCVAECPSTTTGDCSTCAANGYCLSSGSNNYQALTNPPEPLNEDCPPNLFETRELKGTRRCIPTDTNAFNSVVDSLNDATNAEDIISDIILGYWLIGYCVLIALGLAFIGIILMRCFAKPVVYSLILLGMLGSLLLSVYSYQEWKRLDDKIDEQEDAGLTPTESDEDNRSFMYGFMIASFIFTAIVWILVIALRNRIRLAVTIFQEASRAVASMPLIFLTPIYTYAVVILFVAYWLVVFAYMITSGEAEEDVNGHVRYNDSGQSNFTEMFWYHIFGFFWILEFILACAQISLAGAFATWYFTRDKSSIHLPYTRSVGRLIRYHIGTAAFGSLVIAIVSFIRAVITFVHNRTKDRTGVIASVAVKMCICCLWCLEKCLKFLNKNAYIETAIYGHNFCTAARKAFFLLLKNLARVATLNFITWFMLFVIRLLVVAGTGCAAYYWIQNNSELEDGLNYWGVLVFIICILAYFVSGVFFNIFDMAIDTIFICFVEDSSRNNGKDKPYYMSDNLKKFMDKSASNEAE